MTALQPDDLVLALAIALLICGGVMATLSSSPLKRVGGVTLALAGAVASLAAMRAATPALMAGAGAAFVLAALGVALAVKLQEAYGGGDAADYDTADQAAAPKGRDT